MKNRVGTYNKKSSVKLLFTRLDYIILGDLDFPPRITSTYIVIYGEVYIIIINNILLPATRRLKWLTFPGEIATAAVVSRASCGRNARQRKGRKNSNNNFIQHVRRFYRTRRKTGRRVEHRNERCYIAHHYVILCAPTLRCIFIHIKNDL